MRKKHCSHHWVIDFAEGPLSRGECRACGEERLFRNHLLWSEMAPPEATNGRYRLGVDPRPRGRPRPALSPRGAGHGPLCP